MLKPKRRFRQEFLAKPRPKRESLLKAQYVDLGRQQAISDEIIRTLLDSLNQKASLSDVAVNRLARQIKVSNRLGDRFISRDKEIFEGSVQQKFLGHRRGYEEQLHGLRNRQRDISTLLETLFDLRLITDAQYSRMKK